jgi:hypothetical protein
MEVTVSFAFGRNSSKLAFAAVNNVFYIRKGKTWEKARDSVLKEVVEDLSLSPLVPAAQSIKLEDAASNKAAAA